MKNQNNLTELPKGFKLTIDEDRVIVKYKTKNFNDWDNANCIMKKWEKENNLEELGAGTVLSTGVRDWEYKRIV